MFNCDFDNCRLLCDGECAYGEVYWNCPLTRTRLEARAANEKLEQANTQLEKIYHLLGQMID